MDTAAVWIGPASFGPLRVDACQLAFGAVMFVVVHLALTKGMLPRINRVLEQREAATTGRFERAEEVRDEAEKVRAEYEAVLATARHEAARIRQDATEEGTALIAQARAEALLEREILLVEAHKQIATERNTAAAALRSDAQLLAEELAERILGEPVAAQGA